MRTILEHLLFADLDPAQRAKLVQIGIVVFIGFHVAWACGWIPGIPGFAMAGDVTQLSGKVSGIEQSLLEAEIIEAQERLCKADAENNVPAMRYSAERLRELAYQYESMTDKVFRLPTCNELGIS